MGNKKQVTPDIGLASVFRAMYGTPLWNNGRKSKAEAWLELLLSTALSDEEINIEGNIVSLKKSQIIISKKCLATKWQWSRNMVRGFLSSLVEEKMIEIKEENRYSIISVCNLDYYFGLNNNTKDFVGGFLETKPVLETNNNKLQWTDLKTHSGTHLESPENIVPIDLEGSDSNVNGHTFGHTFGHTLQVETHSGTHLESPENIVPIDLEGSDAEVDGHTSGHTSVSKTRIVIPYDRLLLRNNKCYNTLNNNNSRTHAHKGKDEKKEKSSPPLSGAPPSQGITDLVPNTVLPIQTCMEYFLTHRSLSGTKDIYSKSLLKPGGNKAQAEGDLERWAQAFNRCMMQIGECEKPVMGPEGWVKRFVRWLGIYDLSKVNPDTMQTQKHFLDNSTKSYKNQNHGTEKPGTGNQATAANGASQKLGGISKDAAEKFYQTPVPLPVVRKY